MVRWGGAMDEAPETGDIEGLDELTLAVRDLIGESRELVGRVAQATGQHENDMAAVGMLIQFGPMGAAELARRLGIRSATASVLVDRLERDGHAVRVRDTVDRRRVVITETPAARAANLAAWWPAIREIDRVCRAVPAAQRAAALDLLAALTAATARGASVSGRGDTPADGV